MKISKFITFTLLGLLNVADIAYGDTEAGNMAFALVDDLTNNGVQQVGTLNLHQLRNEIREVKWEISASEPPPEIAGFRRSAYYVIGEMKVVLTLSAKSEPVENIKILELHEALGALGYRDQTYSQTSALNILRQTKNLELKNNLIEFYGKTIFSGENLKSLSGGSSVGGGGDSAALVIKNRIITEIINSGLPLDPEFYLQYPEINFEPFEDPQTQHIWAQYQVFRNPGNSTIPGVRTDRSYQELLTLIFPALLWQKDDLQDRIISEIKKLLLGLYPTYANAETYEVHPPGCSDSARLNYPKTNDSSARMIQFGRTRILFDCADFKDGTIFVTSPIWILPPGTKL